MPRHENLRLSPDGRVARQIPAEVRAEARNEWSQDYNWLTFDWPDGLLTVELLTDSDVADWKFVHTEDADG